MFNEDTSIAPRNAPEAVTVFDTRTRTTSVRDIADPVFRHKRLVVALIAIWTGLLAAYLFLARDNYESEMLLLVKNNRPEIVLTTEQSGTMTSSAVSDAQIGTEVQLLSGPELLREVVLKCGLDKKETTRRGGEAAISDATKRLQRDLKVAPVIKADLIKIRYSSANAQQTVNVLKTLVNSYLERHLVAHQSADAYPFFDRQVDGYGKRLRAAQAKLASFQERTNVVLLEQQKDIAVRRGAELEVAQHESQTAQREAARQTDILKQQQAGLSSRITTSARKVPNQYSVERLNTMLAELQNKRTELAAKFNPQDRMVQQVDQQIKDTKAALQSATGLSSTEESTDVNPLRQAVERQMAQVQVAAESARVRGDAAERQLSENKAKLNSLELATADYENLQRDVKELEDNYTLYSKKREEARIAGAMDQQKMANVSVAEGPVFPYIAQDKVTAGVISAYLLGCALVLFGTFFLGSRRRTFETPWEFESYTGMPVLATVPLDRTAAARPTYRALPVGSREILVTEIDQ